jgi:integrase
MASITKLPSGAFRVQIRRKGRYASETFLRREDAQKWARQAETLVDQGLPPNRSSIARLHTFGDLIDLHIADMCAVGKPPRRSKAATLTTLKRDLGSDKIGHLDRHKLIEYGRKRAEQGAGPVTLGIDIGVIKMILTHAAAVHGLEISAECVDLARIALKRLGLIGKGVERDRRPTAAELQRLFRCFDENARLTIPMTRIVQFAVATAMRLDEICRVEWGDLDRERRMLMIRDRKDPRNKAGNDQRIPLLAATGFDAWALVLAQGACRADASGPIFPYNSKSVGTAFRRACADAEITDLHFHDLRHEGTSRLFEVGLSIEQVALVTGHKDWKMLRRYTHIRPESLHRIVAGRAPYVAE